MQPKYLQNRKGSQGVPCSPQKKGSSLMVPFFVGSKGGKCVAFSFSTPSLPSPRGKAWSLRAEAPKGACGSRGILLFGRRWILGHVLGALLRTAAGWRLAAG